ncbi:hypothetical protein GCM10007425_03510 [Lysinibacillus alkalisoli]|uniref:Fe/B12 periplasmic-binding domain-containing protein n=1 Tax=Lysinibacillus alkalisoli TaxID=1911548 RepID=A0A917FXT1_9BACI|nr:ABC transporter substrate-binding protein [Lysinibacillus alkalisoli]GGG12448.1 hypothetical protein GCM10007425_03510 [Lysinibacillus alkalisoli]
MKKISCVLFVLLLVVAACSTNDTKKDESKEQKAATKTITTINGDIEIPTNVERLVVEAYLPTALLLGVKPIGATEQDLLNVHIKDQIEGIENTGESSPEKILALKPDLIITANPDTKVYEKLSKIAPTIVLPYETYRNVDDEVNALAEILGKEKEGDEWLADFHQTVKANRERLEGVMEPNETIALLGAYKDDYYVYGDGIYRGGQAMYQQLQLKPSEGIQKNMIDKDITFQQIAYEVLPEYAGDYIFLDESYSDGMNKDDELWQSLPAVKNDNVFYLDEAVFWPFDPIAVKNQVVVITDWLIDNKEKKQK